MDRFSTEMENLTKKLVSISSINTSQGEKEIAVFIEEYLRNIPYFKKHKNAVIIQKLKDDKLDRRNVFAYIKGENNNSGDTIIFHGHMDTVGVDDFGSLKKYAFDCDKLLNKMLDMDLPEEVHQDLSTGKWMVGRGSCDMKSGVAVFLVLLKTISENVDKLKGNILLSINPVEENLHTGIIEGLDILEMLKEKENFNYKFAINNDYICPLYKGDPKYYVYMGAVGKLLPCFYIQGKETHVGQCFEGFDATKMGAALVDNISLNTDLCDGYEGEYTLPPSVLKMKDLKEQYNVQTAFDAFVYFNYAVHNDDMNSIINKLKKSCYESFGKVLNNLNFEYKKYCDLTGDKFHEYNYEFKFMTYDELLEKAVSESGEKIKSDLKKLTKEYVEKNTDKREIPIYLIKYLLGVLEEKNPAIVLYFAAPYCPHNTLKNEVESEKELKEQISSIVAEFAREENEEYEIKQFFPSLSDSSYIKIDDDNESIDCLIKNFPQYDVLYPVPLKRIKALNIPALNYGCYGKDAHKWTERVYKPYSFEVLPKLILKTVNYYLV